MARRKKTNSKRSKKININLVDTAAAVLIGGAIIDSNTFAGGEFNASPELKSGQYGAALEQIGANLKNKKTQTAVARTVIGSLLFKGVAKALKVRKVAGLGPIAINV